MKKILGLILIAGMAQGLVSQEQPSRYQYLKQLPDYSRIKRMCYPVAESGWYWSRKNECDNLEDFLKDHKKFIDTRTSYTSYNGNPEQEVLNNRNENLRKLLLKKYSEMKKRDIRDFEQLVYSQSNSTLFNVSEIDKIDREDECELMKNLAGKLCKERFDQFEAAILADQK